MEAARYVFVDLDGTLEDSRRDMAEAVVRVRRALGLPPGEAGEHGRHVNRGMNELYRSCFAELVCGGDPRGGDPQALEAVRVAYEGDYLTHVAVHTRAYPGIGEAVAGLSELGRIIIITNKPERISWALLRELGLAGWIADVIGGDTCPEGKPSPAPLRLGVSRQGAPSAAAVMIGDSVADIRAGRGFGAATVWCAWGYAGSPAPEVPDFTCAAAAELVPAARRALSLGEGA